MKSKMYTSSVKLYTGSTITINILILRSIKFCLKFYFNTSAESCFMYLLKTAKFLKIKNL